MFRYALFIEYDGSPSSPVDIALPEEVIEATAITHAVSVYALRHNFELVRYVELSENAARAFFRERRRIGNPRKIICHFHLISGGEEEPQPERKE